MSYARVITTKFVWKVDGMIVGFLQGRTSLFSSDVHREARQNDKVFEPSMDSCKKLLVADRKTFPNTILTVLKM